MDPLLQILPAAIDEPADRSIRRTIALAVASGSRRIVIDLALTDVVETATLRTLIAVSRIVRERGGDVGVIAVREQARTALASTGLDHVFHVYRNAGEAAPPLRTITGG